MDIALKVEDGQAKLTESCPRCSGKGPVAGDACEHCRGRGYTLTENAHALKQLIPYLYPEVLEVSRLIKRIRALEGE